MSAEKETTKTVGRPLGTGTKPGKLLRVLLTPRQERLLTQLRVVNGISESEACRRALDDLFDKLESRGELLDTGKENSSFGSNREKKQKGERNHDKS